MKIIQDFIPKNIREDSNSEFVIRTQNLKIIKIKLKQSLCFGQVLISKDSSDLPKNLGFSLFSKA